MPGRVLVTGVSGVIGSHVALALLYAGYTVRGSIRNPARAPEVIVSLRRAGADVTRLELVELDLTADAGWREAMADCRYLQHVASPLTLGAPRDRSELLVPAIDGTQRAVSAALAAGIERIVVTSTVAAIAAGHPPGRIEPFTGADWSRTAGDDVTVYSEAKTRAELAAWSLVEEAGRRDLLATIHPSFVLGPLLGPDPGLSSQIVSRLLDGRVPLAPRLSFDVVDARDVAALHVAAMEQPSAGGQRLLASAGPIMLADLAQALRAAFPAFSRRLPRLPAPDWIVRLAALLDADIRASLRGLVPGWPGYDSTPARTLLGRPFITPRLAAIATAQSLISLGLVRPPSTQKKD